jgi:hypothetical protein
MSSSRLTESNLPKRKLEQFQHVTGNVPKYKTSGSLTEHILSRNSYITVILFFIKELYVQMFFNTFL